MSFFVRLWRLFQAWRADRAITAMNRKAMAHPHRRASEARPL